MPVDIDGNAYISPCHRRNFQVSASFRKGRWRVFNAYDLFQFILNRQLQTLRVTRSELLSALLVFVLIVDGTDGVDNVLPRQAENVRLCKV